VKLSAPPRGRPAQAIAKNTLGGKIRAARKQAGLSAETLGKRIGIAHQSLTEIERNETKPERRTLILLAQELGDTFGEAWLRAHVKGQPRSVRVEGRVAAGEPIDEVVEGETVAVDPDLVKLTGDVCALSVKGESMIADHILENDILICRRASPADVRPNAIAVVELEDIGATVKRWKRKGQSVTLGSQTYSVSQVRRVFEVAGLIRTMK